MMNMAYPNMREAIAEMIRAGRSWLAAREQRHVQHDLKGDLQIQERNAAQYLEDTLREVNEQQLQLHTDDIHVDAMADDMKARLAEKRAEGRGGWDDAEQCTVEYLAALLVASLFKGNATDVANFAMMLRRRDAHPTVLTDALINHRTRHACLTNLEGLADELLTPGKIERDTHGFLTHPAIPALDEDVRIDDFLHAFGIETAFVEMSGNDAAAFERYLESEDIDCSYWTPSRPNGDGWILAEIYDTEDGPCAMYVRRKPAAPRAPRRSEAMTLQATITRIRYLNGEIALELGHEVPQHFHTGARASLQLLRVRKDAR